MKATSKKKKKWYILSRNSRFEECSIVPLDINGSLAGISVSEAGSASGDISSHDGSKNDTDSDYNTEPSIMHINSFFILQPKKVVAILYSRDSNCKAYNYHKHHKVAGDNF